MGRTVIKRLDNVDDLISSLIKQSENPESKVIRQLKVLRDDLLDLLRTHSIEAFGFDRGTTLDVPTRQLIKIVDTSGRPSMEEKKRPEVMETVRAGYRYASDSESEVTIIRKPEVVVGYR